jgi:hypothetical protein
LLYKKANILRCAASVLYSHSIHDNRSRTSERTAELSIVFGDFLLAIVETSKTKKTGMVLQYHSTPKEERNDAHR